jgi:hypothetical protein
MRRVRCICCSSVAALCKMYEARCIVRGITCLIFTTQYEAVLILATQYEALLASSCKRAAAALLQLLELCCSSRRGKTRHYFPHIFDLGALFGARRRLYLLVIFTTHVYYSCLLLRARRRPRRARLSSQKSSSTRESLRFRTLWGRPQCRQRKARLHNYYSYLLLIFTTHIYYSYLLLIYQDRPPSAQRSPSALHY